MSANQIFELFRLHSVSWLAYCDRAEHFLANFYRKPQNVHFLGKVIQNLFLVVQKVVKKVLATQLPSKKHYFGFNFFDEIHCTAATSLHTAPSRTPRQAQSPPSPNSGVKVPMFRLQNRHRFSPVFFVPCRICSFSHFIPAA